MLLYDDQEWVCKDSEGDGRLHQGNIPAFAFAWEYLESYKKL
jgi:hypothetical protein